MHNHPSGDPTPSQADIQMTRAIVDIATPLLGISVHDHFIVGRNGHASLKDMKLILQCLLWSRADSIADIAVSTRTTPSEHSGLFPSLAERQ